MIRDLFHQVSATASASSPEERASLSPAGLAFADRTQLTLQLRAKRNLPEWLAKEIEARLACNAIRRRQLHGAYAEIAAALTAEQIDFVLLKGFTHETGFGIDPETRIQY